MKTGLGIFLLFVLLAGFLFTFEMIFNEPIKVYSSSGSWGKGEDVIGSFDRTIFVQGDKINTHTKYFGKID